MPADIRWKQRFENFQKALRLLDEPYQRDRASLSDLEKEGIVQRFEITFELGWKTLKDYLLFNGIAFEQITPRSVIKQEFAARVLANGQIWIACWSKETFSPILMTKNFWAARWT
jgi:nucleotidyltransferase substrate binding protein (TIGR01987 family)